MKTTLDYNLHAKQPSPGMMEASLRAIMDCSIPVCREHMTSMLRAITRASRGWEQLMVTVISVSGSSGKLKVETGECSLAEGILTTEKVRMCKSKFTVQKVPARHQLQPIKLEQETSAPILNQS